MKFGNSAEGVSRFSRYGLSEAEWSALTPDERAIHYNRQKVCEHPYVYDGPDKGSWSFDPYAHTAHSRPHSIELFFKGLCECQTCVRGFGIPREEQKRKVDERALREKLELGPDRGRVRG